MTNVRKEFIVSTSDGTKLLGVHPDGFNVIELAMKYGQGTYQVAEFHDGKEFRRYHQTIAPDWEKRPAVTPQPKGVCEP